MTSCVFYYKLYKNDRSLSKNVGECPFLLVYAKKPSAYAEGFYSLIISLKFEFII